MWYHTDVNGRILESAGRRIDPEFQSEIGDSNPNSPASLQLLCAKRIISTKLNFFAAPTAMLPDTVKNMLAQFSGQVLHGLYFRLFLLFTYFL
jgi:hypothetical protein